MFAIDLITVDGRTEERQVESLPSQADLLSFFVEDGKICHKYESVHLAELDENGRVVEYIATAERWPVLQVTFEPRYLELAGL